MDVIETLKQDVREGRIGAERLVDLVAMFQRQLQVTRQQLDSTVSELRAAQQRIDELEKKLGGGGTAKLDEPYSMKAEEKRQETRGQKKKRKEKRKKKRGRVNTQDKIAQAERTEAVYPEGVAPEACRLSHVRVVWRLENGRAVLVAYQIYRDSKKRYGKIPGVLGRSEFGLEIVTQIAFLVYITGLSLDKACQILNFFQDVRLGKSQADALLNQLSRHWASEFETLCTLLANSMVVHADETSWSINSVWAFLSEKARLLLFGVHKDAATLKEILDPATFAGIVSSDDAAVYANFSKAQKCWASRRAGIAQGDQAIVASSERRGVPKLHGSTVGDLPRSMSRATRPTARRCGASAESGRSGRSDFRFVCRSVVRTIAIVHRTRQRLSTAGP